MKYRLKKLKSDPDVVDAIKLKEDKKIKGRYFGEYNVPAGNWLVTYADGTEESFSEESFNKLFEPVKQILLD